MRRDNQGRLEMRTSAEHLHPSHVALRLTEDPLKYWLCDMARDERIVRVGACRRLYPANGLAPAPSNAAKILHSLQKTRACFVRQAKARRRIRVKSTG